MCFNSKCNNKHSSSPVNTDPRISVFMLMSGIGDMVQYIIKHKNEFPTNNSRIYCNYKSEIVYMKIPSKIMQPNRDTVFCLLPYLISFIKSWIFSFIIVKYQYNSERLHIKYLQQFSVQLDYMTSIYQLNSTCKMLTYELYNSTENYDKV